MQTKPKTFDIVRLSVNLPDYNLQRGAEGTIVECHSDGTFEVEFTNERGETLALCALPASQFTVIWQDDPVRRSL